MGVKLRKATCQMKLIAFFAASALSLKLSLFFDFSLPWVLVTTCLLSLWSNWCCCCVCGWLLCFSTASYSVPSLPLSMTVSLWLMASTSTWFGIIITIYNVIEKFKRFQKSTLSGMLKVKT